MPYKVCTKCGEPNGVRTYVCKKCGTTFVAKTQQVSTSATFSISTMATPPKVRKRRKPRQPREVKPKVDLLAEFKRSFVKIDYDPVEKQLSEKYYNGTLETWQSIDGKYLIRYIPYLGTVRLEDQMTTYKLLVKRGNVYELATIRSDPEWSYFANLKQAFQYYMKMVANEDKVVPRKKQRRFWRKRKK